MTDNDEPTYAGYRDRHPAGAGDDDPELLAMRIVAQALGGLDGAERRRVLKWAWARFVPWTVFGNQDQVDDWVEPAES